MDNLTNPTFIRRGIKLTKEPELLFRGTCLCGSPLYEWKKNKQLVCKNCPNPKQAFNKHYEK